MGASSGAILGVPFRGRISLAWESGRSAPSRVAWIANADDACPWLQGREVHLGDGGEFNERDNLLTDTHWVCRDGQLRKEHTVEPAHLLVSAPGCDPVDVWVTQDDRFHDLQLSCSRALAEAQPSLEDLRAIQTGATVEIRDGRLTVEGRSIRLPAQLEKLTAVIGDPSAVLRAGGDKYSNDVWEWEASGIYAYARPGRKRAHTLALLLDPLSNDRHWCNPAVVRLRVNGVAISASTKSADLIAAGFAREEDGWEQSHRGVYFALYDSYRTNGAKFLELEMGAR